MKNNVKLLAGILAATIMIIIIGIAGRQDYEQQVIYTMPNEAYDSIKIKLGVGCTASQIVEEYVTNQEHYNNVK